MVIQSQRPIAQVARELGVNEGTLGTWVSKYRSEHPVTEELSLMCKALHVSRSGFYDWGRAEHSSRAVRLAKGHYPGSQRLERRCSGSCDFGHLLDLESLAHRHHPGEWSMLPQIADRLEGAELPAWFIGHELSSPVATLFPAHDALRIT